MLRLSSLALCLLFTVACAILPMAEPTPCASSGEVTAGPILFSFTPEGPAESVALTGDFHDWSAFGIAMADEDGDGTWTVVHMLEPGDYLYKFIVDGGDMWFHDPDNPEQIDDGYEGFNSVLHVTAGE